MACPCCGVQCGIKSIADSVSVTFSSTFRPWWNDPAVNPTPCDNALTLYLCPYPETNRVGFSGALSLNSENRRQADEEPYSGACDRYDGTYVIDYSDNSASPSDIYQGWCTSAGGRGCNIWSQWSLRWYSASCTEISASHTMGGSNITTTFRAVITSVPEGAPYQTADAGRPGYTVIKEPVKLQTVAGRDWYKARYSFRTFQEIYNAYNNGSTSAAGLPIEQYALCIVTCPQLELG